MQRAPPHYFLMIFDAMPLRRDIFIFDVRRVFQHDDIMPAALIGRISCEVAGLRVCPDHSTGHAHFSADAVIGRQE